MKREEASSKYKWNLQEIYNSQKKWEEDFNEISSIVEEFSKFKGKLNSKECLKEYNKLSEKFERKYNKLYIYSYLSHDIDLKNEVYITNLEKLRNLGSKMSQITCYVDPELASLDESYINDLINDEEFRNYKRRYERVLLYKKHILSEIEEKALATSEDYAGGFSDIYDTLIDTDMFFDPIEVDGKKYKITEESYYKLKYNTNREIRKKAYESLYGGYRKFAHTFAKIFIYNLKVDSSELKLRNYDSCLNGALEGSKIPLSVYDKLVSKVSDNVNVMKYYFKLLSKETEIKDFSFYDSHISISSMDKEFDYKRQTEIVREALSVLGEEYQELLDKAFIENWIDVYPSDNKVRGGYQYGCYDTHPYVLLNNTDNYESMSTLAHELGHAMHSYYSNKNQPYPTSSYSIYVAEVASTVNEILLNRYMIKNSKDINDKIFFTDEYIKTIKSAVFRQTMFSEFEQKVHELVENNNPMSLEIINEEYKKVLDKHFGGVIDVDNNINLEWLRISHFYRPFYVYKYATSYVCANHIATSILKNKNNMKEKYFELLKSGSNDWPNEILKKVGVDLSSNEPYDIVFNDLKEAIKNLEYLLELKKKQESKKTR